MSITVRSAEPSDVPWIMGELRAFDRLFGAQRSLFPDDEEYARTQLRQLIDVGPFFLAERADACPAGFIAGIVTPHWMNPTMRVLSELLWWVAEPFRGSPAGARLLEAFLAHGRAHADWIICTLGRRTGVHGRSLERHGFVCWEQSYLLEVC